MVVLKNSLSNITHNITKNITLYSAITSATFFHLLVKCVLLVFVIWVVFKWEPVSLSNSQILNITYEQKKISISIICILVIAMVWFLKKYKFYPDDLFFIAIILVIWVYAWRQNNTISGFLSKLANMQKSPYPTQNINYSADIIMPSPGTSALDSHGISGAGPVTPSADRRSGVLPEHYDYLPDNMKRVSNPAAFDPMAPLSSSDDELPQFNRMINLMEPSDHPTYKLTNEVLRALENKCLAHDSTDSAKPMTEFMRQNGAGQSKWAFIAESEQSPNVDIQNLVLAQETTRPAKSLNDKAALQEMFENIYEPIKKYDTHNTKNNTTEYNFQSDTANKKYPGVDNHCSLLGYCTNVNLPTANSLTIIATNKVQNK